MLGLDALIALRRSMRQSPYMGNYPKHWNSLRTLVEILDFDDKAAIQLTAMNQNNPQLNKNKFQKDMRIASIALANNAIVVTRNHRDFSQVLGLNIVDWT